MKYKNENIFEELIKALVPIRTGLTGKKKPYTWYKEHSSQIVLFHVVSFWSKYTYDQIRQCQDICWNSDPIHVVPVVT